MYWSLFNTSQIWILWLLYKLISRKPTYILRLLWQMRLSLNFHSRVFPFKRSKKRCPLYQQTALVGVELLFCLVSCTMKHWRFIPASVDNGHVLSTPAVESAVRKSVSFSFCNVTNNQVKPTWKNAQAWESYAARLSEPPMTSPRSETTNGQGEASIGNTALKSYHQGSHWHRQALS